MSDRKYILGEVSVKMNTESKKKNITVMNGKPQPYSVIQTCTLCGKTGKNIDKLDMSNYFHTVCQDCLLQDD